MLHAEGHTQNQPKREIPFFCLQRARQHPNSLPKSLQETITL